MLRPKGPSAPPSAPISSGQPLVIKKHVAISAYFRFAACLLLGVLERLLTAGTKFFPPGRVEVGEGVQALANFPSPRSHSRGEGVANKLLHQKQMVPVWTLRIDGNQIM